jgi:hypothetical protein
MYHSTTFNALTPRNPLSLSVFWRRLIFIPLASFAASTPARAVTPAPDGGYPNNNTAEGQDALAKLASGTDNTATGFQALYSNTKGSENTASGSEALFKNNVGSYNTATGWQALLGNRSGSYNTATGAAALANNTFGGNGNTATGSFALYYNTKAPQNTATGSEALFFNTTGARNTATGYRALRSNTTGINNVASGETSLIGNTTGSNNTATGEGSLPNNDSGGSNTGEGFHALLNNTTGSFNIALGASAGSSLTTGSNNIDIGNPGVAGESSTIRIGNVGTQTATIIAGISGATVSDGVEVVVAANGRLGTITSSARFKENVKPMDQASEALLKLKPVTFRYKREFDPHTITQFGLVAEDVADVNPDLVARDAEGKVYSVRYEAVNAMLLNEFLKEHHTVQELKEIIAKQQKEFQTIVAEHQKQIEALTSTVQRVSEQVALSKPAPQLATANP